MRLAIGAILIVSLAAPAHAQSEKADPRAVDFCRSKASTFVAIAECLPNAHVAFKTLDAFESTYPQSAQPLRSTCAANNEGDVVGASICVVEAIDAAINLKKTLPDGTSLNDPIFDSVLDVTLQERLLEAQEAAKATFPDVRLWGGGLYHPYK